jgi:hypothetical protein
MRSARCRYLARITGVAIVTDSTSYVPAAAGSGLHFEDRGEHRLKGIAQSWRLLALAD